MDIVTFCPRPPLDAYETSSNPIIDTLRARQVSTLHASFRPNQPVAEWDDPQVTTAELLAALDLGNATLRLLRTASPSARNENGSVKLTRVPDDVFEELKEADIAPLQLLAYGNPDLASVAPVLTDPVLVAGDPVAEVRQGLWGTSAQALLESVALELDGYRFGGFAGDQTTRVRTNSRLIAEAEQ